MNMGVASTKSNVKIDKRCESCFLKTYQRLFEKYNLGVVKQKEFIAFYQETIKKNNHLSSPEIQQLLYQKISALSGINDFYSNEKKESNFMAFWLYSDWKKKVQESKFSFNLALKLALAGNIMDYGVSDSFNLERNIERVLIAEFAIDRSVELRDRINNARSILYLGDNAGEIVFDKLFIETINHHNLVYVVRGGAVLNDATMEDAVSVGMDKLVKVISNGFDAPSTIVHKSSLEFQQYFNEADLIISKGQGNFEGLLPLNDKRIFFLLMAKCDVIANMLSVPKESFVVCNSISAN